MAGSSWPAELRDAHRHAFDASVIVARGEAGLPPFGCDLLPRRGARFWFDRAQRRSFRDLPDAPQSTFTLMAQPTGVPPADATIRLRQGGVECGTSRAVPRDAA